MGDAFQLHADARFYQDVLPEALLSFLEGWDLPAARLAAEVFLEKHPKKHPKVAGEP